MSQPKPEVKALSNRDFGLIFSAIFTVFSVYPLLFGNGLRVWTLIIAIGFAIASVATPVLLGPLNKLWVKFGLVMHSIINPFLMGLIFFLTVLPTGIILRLLGKDPMNRKMSPDAKSYWIKRDDKLNKDFFDQQF